MSKLNKMKRLWTQSLPVMQDFKRRNSSKLKLPYLNNKGYQINLREDLDKDKYIKKS